ncbi:unnamed protein product, partial [Prorocentrum cordatum]
VDTLNDLRGCPRLAELYLRKNNVRDLAEVQYLCNLRHLRVLWLNDNPCANLPHYRMYILQRLPSLGKLDSQEVTADERREAQYANLADVPTRVDDDSEESPREEGYPAAEAFDDFHGVESAVAGLSRKQEHVQKAPLRAGQLLADRASDPSFSLRRAARDVNARAFQAARGACDRDDALFLVFRALCASPSYLRAPARPGALAELRGVPGAGRGGRGRRQRSRRGTTRLVNLGPRCNCARLGAYAASVCAKGSRAPHERAAAAMRKRCSRRDSAQNRHPRDPFHVACRLVMTLRTLAP